MNKKEIILGIYKITSPTGRIYIGYTTNRDERWSKYKILKCKDQPAIFNSLKKYGVENHIFEMIHIFENGNLNKSEVIIELKKLEIYYIDLLKSFSGDSEYGLNLTRGGDGGEMSVESRKKLSESNKGERNSMFGKPKNGKNNPMFGKKQSEESNRKNSEAHKGEKNCNYGKKQPKAIESMRQKNLGKKLLPESIAKREKTRIILRQERRTMIF